ncbi:hypothetical protein ADUPG1_011894 [Aduncisulcus paluster]|uniref:Reverse transcriptase domain-containing protein n=1 Tax=Aduncisulcus paluster TaxID=2918883 RepID=A0ABQ5JXJ7_9EUKA|nr:hypothetical protein ADUPG1_011894 [Aduncisulcus paluster]
MLSSRFCFNGCLQKSFLQKSLSLGGGGTSILGIEIFLMIGVAWRRNGRFWESGRHCIEKYIEESCHGMQAREEEVLHDDSRKRKRKSDPGEKSNVCPACGRFGHTRENCWKEHPELRPKNNTKKEYLMKLSDTISSSDQKDKSTIEVEIMVGPIVYSYDIIRALDGNRWFAIRLISGFNQVGVRKEDRYLTAFTVLGRLFQYKAMPFGATNAPIHFQQVLMEAMEDLIPECCQIFIDDIIVYGKTEEEFERSLKRVLDRLSRLNIKAKASKCSFGF